MLSLVMIVMYFTLPDTVAFELLDALKICIPFDLFNIGLGYLIGRKDV